MIRELYLLSISRIHFLINSVPRFRRRLGYFPAGSIQKKQCQHLLRALHFTENGVSVIVTLANKELMPSRQSCIGRVLLFNNLCKM